MENASKALIIAGAILIAILLISVGIMVMNSVNKPIDQVTSESASQAVQIFNSRYTSFLGTKKSANEVLQLLEMMSTNNRTNSHKIKLQLMYHEGTGSSLIAFNSDSGNNEKISGAYITKIYNGITYTVKAGDATGQNGYDSEGYLKAIYITEE